jgi:hypothetical protein
LRLHFRKVAPGIHQRAQGHVTANSGEAIKVGYFHVAKLMVRGRDRSEECAPKKKMTLPEWILAPRFNAVKFAPKMAKLSPAISREDHAIMPPLLLRRAWARIALRRTER